jgi:hypothetical protein
MITAAPTEAQGTLPHGVSDQDSPMIQHLQGFHGPRILVPDAARLRPNPAF